MKKVRETKPAVSLIALILCLLSGLGWLGYKQAATQGRANRLFAALHDGDSAGVQAALEQGADPNARQTTGTVPVGLFADARQWFFQMLHPAQTETALTAAVTSEDPECVRLLLSREALPNLRNGDGSTPLMAAAAIHHYGIGLTVPPEVKKQSLVMQALLDRGADVNARDGEGNTALTTSVPNLFNGTLDLTVTHFLLDHGADANTKTKAGQTLLDWAIEGANNGMVPLVSLLLDHGANVNVTDGNGWTPLSRACEWINPALVGTLLTHGANPNVHSPANDMTPLIQAARQGQIGTINLLLDKGADVNAYSKFDSSALFVATQQNHADVVQLLLKQGANPNFINDFEMRAPALVVAAARSNTRIVKLLLTHGADVNLKGQDDTPLTAAASACLAHAYAERHNNTWNPGDLRGILPVSPPCPTAVTQILLSAGAAPNESNTSGNTALVYAVAGHNVPLARLLLAHGASPAAPGANPYVPSSAGETPLKLASERGYADLIPLLRQYPHSAQ